MESLIKNKEYSYIFNLFNDFNPYITSIPIKNPINKVSSLRKTNRKSFVLNSNKELISYEKKDKAYNTKTMNSNASCINLTESDWKAISLSIRNNNYDFIDNLITYLKQIHCNLHLTCIIEKIGMYYIKDVNFIFNLTIIVLIIFEYINVKEIEEYLDSSSKNKKIDSFILDKKEEDNDINEFIYDEEIDISEYCANLNKNELILKFFKKKKESKQNSSESDNVEISNSIRAETIYNYNSKANAYLRNLKSKDNEDNIEGYYYKNICCDDVKKYLNINNNDESIINNKQKHNSHFNFSIITQDLFNIESKNNSKVNSPTHNNSKDTYFSYTSNEMKACKTAYVIKNTKLRIASKSKEKEKKVRFDNKFNQNKSNIDNNISSNDTIQSRNIECFMNEDIKRLESEINNCKDMMDKIEKNFVSSLTANSFNFLKNNKDSFSNIDKHCNVSKNINFFNKTSEAYLLNLIVLSLLIKLSFLDLSYIGLLKNILVFTSNTLNIQVNDDFVLHNIELLEKESSVELFKYLTNYRTLRLHNKEKNYLNENESIFSKETDISHIPMSNYSEVNSCNQSIVNHLNNDDIYSNSLNLFSVKEASFKEENEDLVKKKM